MIGTLLFAIATLQTLKNPLPLPIKGLHLGAPSAGELSKFTNFVKDDLTKEGVNTLVVEFDYGFKFKTHPEIASDGALTEPQVKEIVHACHDAHIRLIPQINLLGHQSWAAHTDSLLVKHPEFDETPGKYPNNKGIYCRSYCPLAPGLHALLFDIIDELCDACESDAFHAGMDEVFIIGDKDCPRCHGKPPAELFAGEVNALYDHLKSKNRQMWMWGDRFLDGHSNGLGEWEASIVNTQDAINKVPKDITICDWHYEHAEPTPAYFAINGFPVLASPWRKSDLALEQLTMVEALRKESNPKMGANAKGVLHTTWCGAGPFMRAYYGDTKVQKDAKESAQCFKDLFKKIREDEAAKS